MKELTPRLLAMAEEIDRGSTMADVGTDHGYLPLYLRQKGICPSVIVADVSRGSLQKAAENFAAAGFAGAGLTSAGSAAGLAGEGGVSFRLGDGLAVLEKGEADVIVIAGMGGILISRILQDGREKALSCRRLILQPRNNAGVLRRYLAENGFAREKEKLVREGRFICEIIVCRPCQAGDKDERKGAGGRPHAQDEYGIEAEYITQAEYKYPAALLECESPLREEYLYNALRKEKRIEAAKARSQSVSAGELAEQRQLVSHLERLVKKL